MGPAGLASTMDAGDLMVSNSVTGRNQGRFTGSSSVCHCTKECGRRAPDIPYTSSLEIMFPVKRMCEIQGVKMSKKMHDMISETKSAHITSADGNVFSDLGFAPEEAAALKTESARVIAEKRALLQPPAPSPRPDSSR